MTLAILAAAAPPTILTILLPSGNFDPTMKESLALLIATYPAPSSPRCECNGAIWCGR